MQGLQRLRDVIQTAVASRPLLPGSIATQKDVQTSRSWTLRNTSAQFSLEPQFTKFKILAQLLEQVYIGSSLEMDGFGQCVVTLCNGQTYTGGVDDISNLLLGASPECKAWRRHEGLEK